MKIDEANKIFNVWKEWFWPCHFILYSIFGTTIPESFLPYDKDTLEKALNIVAEDYHNSGNVEASKDIQRSIGSLIYYCKDKHGIKHLKIYMNNPELEEIINIRISNYKEEYQKWISKK